MDTAHLFSIVKFAWVLSHLDIVVSILKKYCNVYFIATCYRSPDFDQKWTAAIFKAITLLFS